MRLQAVADTGPLFALAKLGRLELFAQSEILVPEQVRGEVFAGLTATENAAFDAAIGLKIVAGTVIDPLLSAMLDPGESAALTLARERNIPLVLIDERKGRRVARQVYGLQTIGTARVLVEARREGLISSAREELLRLREFGYWLANDIIDWAAEEAQEQG